jgi:hypothetical protein
MNKTDAMKLADIGLSNGVLLAYFEDAFPGWKWKQYVTKTRGYTIRVVYRGKVVGRMYMLPKPTPQTREQRNAKRRAKRAREAIATKKKAAKVLFREIGNALREVKKTGESVYNGSVRHFPNDQMKTRT